MVSVNGNAVFFPGITVRGFVRTLSLDLFSSQHCREPSIKSARFHGAHSPWRR